MWSYLRSHFSRLGSCCWSGKVVKPFKTGCEVEPGDLRSEPAAMYSYVSEAVFREQTINSCSVSTRNPAYARATLPSLHTSSDESLESSLRRDLTIATVSRDTSEVFEHRGMTKIKIVLSASLQFPPFVSLHPMKKLIWGSERYCILRSELVCIRKGKTLSLLSGGHWGLNVHVTKV